jgi:hypothetical protein
MARLGVAPHVADKILNHVAGTISGVAAVYQRHEFLKERRDALERWGAHVESLLEEGEAIELRAASWAVDKSRSLPQVMTRHHRREAAITQFVTETQAEAILADLRPWLRDRPPIDQFREELDAAVETIWAIHRVTDHHRVADEAFRRLRRERQRAKSELRAMEESSTVPEMVNFFGLLKLDEMSYAINEMLWTCPEFQQPLLAERTRDQKAQIRVSGMGTSCGILLKLQKAWESA